MSKKLTKKNISDIGSFLGDATSMFGLGATNAQIKDTSAEESEINALKDTDVSAATLDNLAFGFNPNILAKTNYRAEDLRGLSEGQLIGNTISGTLSGVGEGLLKGNYGEAFLKGFGNLASGSLGAIIGNTRAHNKASELNSKAVEANNIYLNRYSSEVNKIQDKMFNNSLLNLAAYGGPLYNFSGNFSNGLTFINEGGLHSENPLGGVPMGVDNQGTPNLVEEGEVIWNDYVFSNRLKPRLKDLEIMKWDKKYNGWTFARIVEDLQKESANSPNDYISKNTLEDNLNTLMTMQEEIRMKKQQNSFKYGGKKGNVFSKGGDKSNLLDDILNSTDWLDAIINSNDIPTMDTTIPVQTDDIGLPSFMYNGKEISDYEFFNKLNSGTAQIGNKYFPKKDTGFLRYMSPFVHAGTLINNLRKPDYSNAERIEKASRNMPGGTFTPLGDFISLNRVDPNIMINPILANSAANRRAIQNQAINSGQTIAGLLANNYNTNLNLGQAYIQGLQANNEIGVTEAQFDKDTRKYNSQAGMQTLQMGQSKAAQELQGIITGAQLRDSYDAMRNQAISQSIKGLTGDLGNMGRESSDRGLMEKLIESGALRWSAKNGGMLTKKKRK